MKVFVYGSKIRDGVAHHLMGDSKYIGMGILKGYKYHFNKLTNSHYITPDKESETWGEVYEVSQKIKKDLDIYELTGSLYQKREEVIQMADKTLKCFVYVGDQIRKVEEIIF